MAIRSNFSDSGLDIGSNSNNMTYLYGLSDFFSVMFEDTSTVNLFLEAETEVASEIYSRFLQYTSSLSLQGIQEVTNSTVKLVLLSSTDKVQGEINTYTLPENIQTSKYVANRAFLPTELLDTDVDFSITQQSDGSCWIKFAKPISSYALPVRLLPDGTTEQYALWMVDAEIDERLISSFYGNLIGTTPQNASAQFADFVYGLFYVYTHGPKLDTLARGLNLVLGIPVARSSEHVVSIRKYLETDQYLVICDQNQYLIPYGLAPSVSEGNLLSVGQSLAQWVELKDYETNGDWWVNLQIPSKIIPEVPNGQKDRYATSGSHYDYLMRTFLKSHTFLVKVNISNFKNIQKYSKIAEVINRAKPCYTEAIYIWAAENSEVLELREESSNRLDGTWDETIIPSIGRLRRDNVSDPIYRGQLSFIRYNIDSNFTGVCGTQGYATNFTTTLGDSPVSGYVNSVKQFRENTDLERGWIRAVLNRGHDCFNGNRGKIGFNRGFLSHDPLSSGGATLTLETVGGISSERSVPDWKQPSGMRVVPLYTTTVQDITSRMASIGLPEPYDNEWFFYIFKQEDVSASINSYQINQSAPIYDDAMLLNNYALFINVPLRTNFLGREFGKQSLDMFLPPIDKIARGDYLQCVRITNRVVGVYLVTSTYDPEAPAYFEVGSSDPMVVEFNSPISRGMGHNGAPFYVARGVGALTYNSIDRSLNSYPINDYIDGTSGDTTMVYRDKYNTVSQPINRSGVRITHAVELL